MNMYSFELENEDSLIRIDTKMGSSDFSLALDTGATHTVIDLTIMLMNGFSLADAHRVVEFETAKGVVAAFIFEVPSLTALGITRRNVEVSSYDFLGNNVVVDFDGVLGLDFFRKKVLTVDFKQFQILVS